MEQPWGGGSRLVLRPHVCNALLVGVNQRFPKAQLLLRGRVEEKFPGAGVQASTLVLA
jgi:hypothetical protein